MPKPANNKPSSQSLPIPEIRVPFAKTKRAFLANAASAWDAWMAAHPEPKKPRGRQPHSNQALEEAIDRLIDDKKPEGATTQKQLDAWLKAPETVRVLADMAEGIAEQLVDMKEGDAHGIPTSRRTVERYVQRRLSDRKSFLAQSASDWNYRQERQPREYDAMVSGTWKFNRPSAQVIALMLQAETLKPSRPATKRLQRDLMRELDTMCMADDRRKDMATQFKILKKQEQASARASMREAAGIIDRQYQQLAPLIQRFENLLPPEERTREPKIDAALAMFFDLIDRPT